jgi:hypothetical protein
MNVVKVALVAAQDGALRRRRRAADGRRGFTRFVAGGRVKIDRHAIERTIGPTNIRLTGRPELGSVHCASAKPEHWRTLGAAFRSRSSGRV